MTNDDEPQTAAEALRRANAEYPELIATLDAFIEGNEWEQSAADVQRAVAALRHLFLNAGITQNLQVTEATDRLERVEARLARIERALSLPPITLLPETPDHG